jgi:triosephosphate isomerase
MREKIVAGNWKMNLLGEEGAKLVEGIKPSSKCRTVIFPPAIYLNILQSISAAKGITIGAQNGYSADSGAFTGEVSMAQLSALGLQTVLVGHSERRSMFGETDALLKEKVDAALRHTITPFFCCGETLEERKTGNHFAAVANQLRNALFHLSAEEFSKIVIAYEPVWAIGTGETASPEQAEEMHAHIRTLLADKFGKEAATACTILYGGSCNPSNAKALFSMPNIDGGLIGGASLKAESFNQIIAAF